MRQAPVVQHLVRSSAIAGYDRLARVVGLDPERMLGEVGIPVSYLGESDLYFPYEWLIVLLENSARECGRASFGAELGHAQGPAILGPIAYLMRSSETLADAFRGLSRHYHLHSSGADVRVERHGNTGRLCYALKVSSTTPTSQAVELAIAVGYTLLRALLHATPPVRECVFRHAPLYALSTYRSLFGVAPRFNGEFDGYTVDARVLDTPLSSADAVLHRLMSQQLRDLEARFNDSLPARVESVIRGALPHGSTVLQDVAAQLATSPRSLQRALQAEGTSFQQVLDKVRRDIAQHYLRESRLPLTQIAQLLGYGELSNLTRAFRRWHGTSPRRWRTLHQRGSTPYAATG